MPYKHSSLPLSIHSDINLLREPASGSCGARHPHVLNVHSGACAPDSPDAGPLATISVAMYICCAVVLAACGGSEVPSANPVPPAASADADAFAVSAVAAAPVVAAAAKEKTGKLPVADGLALAQKNNCLACHSIDKKMIGPAWMDVSRRYKGVPGIEQTLVVKVSTGGYGNWGNMPMPALAPDVKEEDIRTLVRFILGLSG